MRKLKKKADMAAKTGAGLGKKAVGKAPDVGKQLRERGIESIKEGIGAARKGSLSSDKNIELLKKLAELKSEGIISEEEFEAKKKEILQRI